MGIDMTCTGLSVEDLLGCSFGLSKREVAVLLRLLHAPDHGASGPKSSGSTASEGWVPVSDIAAKTRRDRSVVQRTLQKLVEKGIAERSQRNRPGGGYEYLYKASDKKALKAAITEKSRMFCLKVAAQVREW
jgi:predicted transcriptional regulator